MANYVISSGQTSAYDVGSGETLTVLSGGRSHDSMVNSGGIEVVSSGGVARGDVISSGGIDVFDRGGTENDVTVSSGGVLALSYAVVRNGAYLDVGEADQPDQFAGVKLQTGAAVWSLDTLVGAGGTEYVSSNGVAFNTTISNGGEQVVYSGGVADGATIARGGLLLAAGILDGTLSDAGQIAYEGTGSATLTGVLTGAGVLLDDQEAVLTVSASATGFNGRADLEEGDLDVAVANGLGAATVDFLDTGAPETLIVGAADTPATGGTFANTLDDFNVARKRVDLGSIAYVAGATATVAGSTLTLRDGAYTASFQLTGVVSTEYVVSSDVNGGTLIHAESGAATASLLQAAAAFAPASAAPSALAPAPMVAELGRIAGPSSLHRTRA